MKKFKILFLMTLAVLMCSCKSKLVTSTERISPLIIKSLQNETVDTSSLNAEEKDIFEKFITSEKRENKIVNISETVTLSLESYSNQPNTNKMYKENGNYYIKYSDIKWVPVYDDSKFVVTIDGRQTAIFKSLLPILYEDTVNNPKYNYVYAGKVKEDDVLTYHYKSIYDNSGLKIIYHLDKSDIKYISMVYQDIFYMKDNHESTKNDSPFLQIFIVIAIFILIAVGAIKLIKHSRKDY